MNVVRSGLVHAEWWRTAVVGKSHVVLLCESAWRHSSVLPLVYEAPRDVQRVDLAVDCMACLVASVR